MITVNPKAFAAAVARAASVVPGRTTYPILSNMKLEAADGQLTIAASDLDTEITIRMPARGALAATCLPAQRLRSIAAALKERESLDLENSDDMMSAVIKAGRSRFTVPALLADGFPSLKSVTEPARLTLDAADIVAALKATECSISHEETRYYLNGVCVQSGRMDDQSDTGFITMVATDGHKEMVRHLPAQLDGDLYAPIVPYKACGLLRDILPHEGEVTLQISENRFGVELEDCLFTSKLIEGTYPDWRRVTPKREPDYSFDSPALVAALKLLAAGVSTGKSGKAVPVRAEFDDNAAVLSIKSADGAEQAEEVCPHSLLNEKATREVGLNLDYLIAVIEAMDCDTIQLSLGAMNDPILITSATQDDRKAVVMPMRV